MTKRRYYKPIPPVRPGRAREFTPRPAAKPAAVRIVDQDGVTNIYRDNKRIGYVNDDGWLHMIGLDGYATPVCEVANREAIAAAVARAVIPGAH